MTYETVTAISSMVGLMLFIALFAAVVVYALWPRNRDKFRHAANLPLDDDDLDMPPISKHADGR